MNARATAGGLILLACASAGGCARAPEDRAKRCAGAFVGAMRDGNLDGAMSQTAVPFLFVGQTAKGDTIEVVDSADALRAKLKGGADRAAADPDRHRAVVREAIPAAQVKAAYGGKFKPETLAAVERVMGADGFVVTFDVNGRPAGALVVAMTGKAAVAGALP